MSGGGHAGAQVTPGVEEVLVDRVAVGVEPNCLEQLKALSAAIGELTERQREVFVAIALNDVPIDVLPWNSSSLARMFTSASLAACWARSSNSGPRIEPS